MNTISLNQLERAFRECAADLRALHARCVADAPNYHVSLEDLTTAIKAGANKYLMTRAPQPRARAMTSGDTETAADLPATSFGEVTEETDLAVQEDSPLTELSTAGLRQFINDLQISDLYLAVACAQGNEAAWWDFDAGYRRFIERVAQHLAGAATDAEEVVDFVYTELYGTRVVEGLRQSKFATYSGRGSLRGWLRAIVWHAVVDLHRARRDEVTIDEWSESGGEMQDRPGRRGFSQTSGDGSMVEVIARERYGAATAAALDAAFASLDDHEKLLLLYYHVENLKLREIARLVEEPKSPLRRWFQRKSKPGGGGESAKARVYESTVMRWLEKVYARTQKRFEEELQDKHRFSAEEVALCIGMASDGFAPDNIQRHLLNRPAEKVGKISSE